MSVTGSIDGGGTFVISDEDWAEAKAKPVFLGAAAPAANRVLDAVLRAGPDSAFKPVKGDAIQVRKVGAQQPWGAREVVDVATDTYVVTATDSGLRLRPFAEFEMRRHIPGTEPQPTVDPWVPARQYAVGDRALYEGEEWVCQQAHQSQGGWEPPNTPALWARV